MPFIGSATIVQIGDDQCVITGLALAPANGTGTIGFHGSGADVELPATFFASSYLFLGQLVDLSSALDVGIDPVSHGPLTNLQPSVDFSGTLTGLNPPSLRIGITNTSASLNTQTLRISIRNRGAGKTTQPAEIGST